MSVMNLRLAEAICWTLLHSLWEGLAVALLAGLFLTVARGRSAVLRYNGLIALVILFLGCVGFTALREWDFAAAAAPGGRVAHIWAQAVRVAPQSARQALAPIREYWASVPRWIDLHAAWCVLAWSLMLFVKFVRLGSDLVQVTRLRCRGTAPLPAAWRQTTELLSRRLGISKPVRVLESALVRIPCTLGCLKPLVLLPVGLLVQLPPEETESILLHELAHVRRADYLVNLLQALVDAAFFFNPALLWLSGRIREEREHCCDDLAIRVGGSRNGLVKALVAFQEWSLDPRAAALAFAGRRHALRSRVARILGYRLQILNAMEKSMLTLGLVVAGLCTAALAHSARHEAVRMQTPAVIRDTVPAVNSEEEQQKREDRQKVEERVKADDQRAEARELDRQSRRAQELENRERLQALREEEQKALVVVREKSREIAEEMRRQGEQMREEVETLRSSDLAAAEHQRARIDSMRNIWEGQREAIRQSMDSTRAILEQHRDEMRSKMAALREAMINFLVKAGAVPAGESVHSIEFRDNELIVNGVKQPDAIFKAFQEKFHQGSQKSDPGSEGNSQ